MIALVKLLRKGGTYLIEVLMLLVTISLNYRHLRIRQEAIQILSTLPTTLAGWSSRILQGILSWMSEIEELGLGEEEYVPEDSIAKIIEWEFDDEKKSAFVACLQGPLEKKVLRETVIHW